MKPSPYQNSLVDRAARDALREEIPLPDLLLDGLPFEPALWNVVVEPIVPRTVSDGGIVVVDVSREAEGFQVTVGRVLACGPAAFEGKTSSGIDLSNFTRGIRSAEQLVGKSVVWKRYAGLELTLRDTGQMVRVMAITDFLGVTDKPDAWKFYI